jgi:excisionase family DNA binding protein
MRPPDSTDHRLALSVRETAAATGLSERSVWKLIERRELESVRVGRRRLVPVDAIRKLLASSTERRHP